jgi:hypothetical protein
MQELAIASVGQVIMIFLATGSQNEKSSRHFKSQNDWIDPMEEVWKANKRWLMSEMPHPCQHHR